MDWWATGITQCNIRRIKGKKKLTLVSINNFQACVSTAAEKVCTKCELCKKPVTQQDLSSTALIQQRKTNKLLYSLESLPVWPVNLKTQWNFLSSQTNWTLPHYSFWTVITFVSMFLSFPLHYVKCLSSTLFCTVAGGVTSPNTCHCRSCQQMHTLPKMGTKSHLHISTITNYCFTFYLMCY